MSPVFAHGQLRLYLLALLADGPRHGYEVMQDLQDRFRGLYSPSAGTVYPRLAKLEQEGLVERDEQGRKTIYRLTALGRDEVTARAEEIAGLHAELDLSVGRLADEVRSTVRGRSSDLRAELTAAARAARESATPVTGQQARARPDARFGQDWGALETALAGLRAQARSGRRTLSPDQVRRIVAIVGDASERIAGVIREG